MSMKQTTQPAVNQRTCPILEFFPQFMARQQDSETVISRIQEVPITYQMEFKPDRNKQDGNAAEGRVPRTNTKMREYGRSLSGRVLNLFDTGIWRAAYKQRNHHGQ